MFFFFNDTATTEIYTLSLHDALPIYHSRRVLVRLSWADKSRHRKRRSRTEGGRCKQKTIGCSYRNDRASGPILSTYCRDLRQPKFASSCPAEAKLLLDRHSFSA